MWSSELSSHVFVIINCGLNHRGGKQHEKNTWGFCIQNGTMRLDLLLINNSSVSHKNVNFTAFFRKNTWFFFLGINIRNCMLELFLYMELLDNENGLIFKNRCWDFINAILTLFAVLTPLEIEFSLRRIIYFQ